MSNTRRIKILNIITRMELGGPPIILIDTIQRLNKEYFESSIVSGITADSRYDMIASARNRNINVFTMPSLVRNVHPLKDITSLIKLFFLLKKEKYDVVHCHTSKGGYLGRLAAKMAGAKVIIYSPHGDIFEGYFPKIVTNTFILLERFMARFTDKIINLSTKEMNRFLMLGIGTKQQLKHIYNGIDITASELISLANIRKRDELKLRNGDFVCATVARLVPVKGHTYLIKAIEKVVNIIPEARFLFIGDGELKSELLRQIKSFGLEDNIRILGARNDIEEILSCVNVFVLPSLNEGFGISLVEAMAAKKPAIATTVGGIPEVVIDGKTGLLVPPKNPEALASTIIKLYQDPELARRMGLAGYRRAKDIFNIETTVCELENLYKELIEEKGFALWSA